MGRSRKVINGQSSPNILLTTSGAM